MRLTFVARAVAFVVACGTDARAAAVDQAGPSGSSASTPATVRAIRISAAQFPEDTYMRTNRAVFMKMQHLLRYRS